MGSPMVARLVAAGHEVGVLGRSDAKRASITQVGARAVAEATAVCTDADVVIVCVFTDEQVREVCLDNGLVAAMPTGSALVLHTTGSPRTVESIAQQSASRGVEVVDAPVSGGPHNAAAGALTLFAVDLGARLGVTESALLSALPHRSAASRVLDIVARHGSVSSFIDTAGEFVAKDIAVVRGIAAELGSDLGVLDGVIDADVSSVK
jgi:2-hydroxy-3-oxopropionate reductase